jgi:FtsZ-binding cell division protein ZapB
MRNPIDSVTQFCLIQLEILKTRESRLRKELQDCNIQREFLSQTLQDLGRKEPIEKDIVSNLMDTMRSSKK